MRKAIIAILLGATMATPVVAQDKYERARERYERQAERNQQRSEQRSERREVRQEQRQQRVEQRQPRVEQREVRRERPAGVFGQTVRDANRDREAWQQRSDRSENRDAWQRGDRSGNTDERFERRQQRERDRVVRGDRETFRDHVRETREASERSADGVIPRYRRQAERNQERYERDLREDRREWRQERRADRRDHRRWDRNWRHDRRYDWRDYRYSNRDLYRWGRYYSPYRNHRYSRLSIGIQLGSPFYSDRYWISDPWQYRLPQAYPGTRWIRYYDDVLLVDMYTGEVIDVIYDFFW